MALAANNNDATKAHRIPSTLGQHITMTHESSHWWFALERGM